MQTEKLPPGNKRMMLTEMKTAFFKNVEPIPIQWIGQAFLKAPQSYKAEQVLKFNQPPPENKSTTPTEAPREARMPSSLRDILVPPLAKIETRPTVEPQARC